MATIAYNGIIYGNNTVELTKTEYDALSSVVLTDGKTYFITDVEADIDSLRYKTAIITLLANGFETGKIQTVLVDEVTSNSIV